MKEITDKESSKKRNHLAEDMLKVKEESDKLYANHKFNWTLEELTALLKSIYDKPKDDGIKTRTGETHMP